MFIKFTYLVGRKLVIFGIILYNKFISHFDYIDIVWELENMRLRKQALGNRNLVGARVEMARKKQGMKQKELLAQLQVNGVDMNASGLSKLEGQIRFVTDVELAALADILEVSVDWLLGRKE